MADVHLPQLDDDEPEVTIPDEEPAPSRRGSHSLLKLGLEVLLISVGVFLGLAGESWRERARHRELAEASLRRFRAEIISNREQVSAVKDYHAKTLLSVRAYLKSDPGARSEVNIQGLRPVNFEHAAWDLALATQSLADIDPQIAFDLARVYNVQQMYLELSRGIITTVYLKPPKEDPEAFWTAVSYYYGDIVLIEPGLIKSYDELLPKIDRAVGDKPEAGAPAK